MLRSAGKEADMAAEAMTSEAVGVGVARGEGKHTWPLLAKGKALLRNCKPIHSINLVANLFFFYI
jgi:hypothetical protein